ncbi:MAG TPA: hypothetical protein VGG11_19975 [Xanthobacteraceae bacterium]|jgi:DNA-binding NarL/FixJ family response regulator
MRHEIPAVIIAPDSALRDALQGNLRPPAFRIIASKATLTDVSRGQLPQSQPYLIVIECGERLGPHTAQIAELKRQSPLARIVILGRRWTSADIARAFEAGANAYFAEATVGKEFTQAMKLITR